MEPRLRAVVYGPLYLLDLRRLDRRGRRWRPGSGVAYAHRSPINWIGIYACVLGFLFYATRETLPADILGSIEHLPWVRRLRGGWRRFAAFLKFEEDRLLAPRRARDRPRRARRQPTPNRRQTTPRRRLPMFKASLVAHRPAC